MADRKLGPKAKELLAHFIALEAIPPSGNFADGVNFLLDAERRRKGMERALSKTKAALDAIKAAPDNPYGDDDEAIAAAILEKLESRKEANK
jgi:hypothetical protein